MATIDTRLGKIEQGINNLTESFRKSEEYRIKDHDFLLKLGQKVENICEDVDELKKERQQANKDKSSRLWQGVFILIGAAIGALSAWFTAWIRGEHE